MYLAKLIKNQSPGKRGVIINIMFNFFKPNKAEAASRKSFDKMQQILFDADNYMKAGHKDVAKALLHELVREAERNTDQIAEEIYPPIMPVLNFPKNATTDQVQEVDFENDYHPYMCNNCSCVHILARCPGCGKQTGPEDFLPVNENESEEPEPAKYPQQYGRGQRPEAQNAGGNIPDGVKFEDIKPGSTEYEFTGNRYVIRYDGIQYFHILDKKHQKYELTYIENGDEAIATLNQLNKNYLDSITPAPNE